MNHFFEDTHGGAGIRRVIASILALPKVLSAYLGHFSASWKGAVFSVEKEIDMYKVSVMYPNQKGSRFDLDYYCTTHMALVEKHLKPFGLLRAEVLRGISGGGGQPAPYVCIGNLYFDSADGYEKGGAASGGVLRADIPNFTDVTPVRQISEVLTIG